MNDGPATMTSQGPAARWASARAGSRQALTTPPGATTWWRIREASSPFRSRTRIRAAGPLSVGCNSVDQLDRAAVDHPVGHVAPPEADPEPGQHRVEEAVVDGREDGVEDRQRGAQHASQSEAEAEDVEVGGERLA